MSTIKEIMSQLSVSAAYDDIQFPIVLNALREVIECVPGANDTERMVHFVGLMLDHGFIAVTSPYDDPPSAPWPGDRAAILKRLRREWEALDHEVTFLDLCWFHRS